jgi:hypothetical protein
VWSSKFNSHCCHKKGMLLRENVIYKNFTVHTNILITSYFIWLSLLEFIHNIYLIIFNKACQRTHTQTNTNKKEIPFYKYIYICISVYMCIYIYSGFWEKTGFSPGIPEKIYGKYYSWDNFFPVVEEINTLKNWKGNIFGR